MDRRPMTPEGYEQLQKELNERLSNRQHIIVQIQEARAHGDLSENAEYDAAKSMQGENERRIEELRVELALAQVISSDQIPEGEVVTFGAWVTLVEEESEEEVCYKIVGRSEADVKEKKISIESPLGKAILGKKIGDSVHVITPKSEKIYEICGVSNRPLERASEIAGE